MPLAITEDHRALADVAKAMVAGRSGTSGARRILLEPKTQGRWWLDDGLWKEIVSTGWLGLHVDAQFGGEGYGLPELTIVLEQMGRAAIAGPFLPTVAASAVIAEAGTGEQRRRWLPRLTAGDIVAGIGTTSYATRSDSVVTANTVAALAELAADIFLIPVGEDLVLVESGAGVETRSIETTDQVMRPITVLDLSSAPVADVFPGAASIAVRLVQLLAAAEAVGGLAACTEMATAYAATREQFGRPIGSFQAVKHQCADMLVDTELSVAVTWDAARANGSEAVLAATMAAGQVLPAYQRVALQNVQVHGGIGYSWEHDAHLYPGGKRGFSCSRGGRTRCRRTSPSGRGRANVAAIQSICHQRQRSIAGLLRNFGGAHAHRRRRTAETLGSQWISPAALAEALWQSGGLRRTVDHRGSARRTREAQYRPGDVGVAHAAAARQRRADRAIDVAQSGGRPAVVPALQ